MRALDVLGCYGLSQISVMLKSLQERCIHSQQIMKLGDIREKYIYIYVYIYVLGYLVRGKSRKTPGHMV